jgi:hypothetical protein
LYFWPAAFNAGGAVWHAVQGFFSFEAMAGVAIDCADPITIIAPASKTADTIAAARLATPRVFAFRIIDLLSTPSIHPVLPE